MNLTDEQREIVSEQCSMCLYWDQDDWCRYDIVMEAPRYDPTPTDKCYAYEEKPPGVREPLLQTVQVMHLQDYIDGFEAGVAKCNDRCARLEAEVHRLLTSTPDQREVIIEAEKRRFWREYNDRP